MLRAGAASHDTGTVVLVVTCCDHSDETLAVVVDLVTPLQRLLAGALEEDESERAGLRPYLDGQPDRMEGGVAIILLLFVAVAVVFIVAMYLTGGAFLSRADKNDQPPREKSDPVDRSDVYTQHNELR